MLPQAQAAMVAAMAGWANPSSPHSDGRAARAMLEDARRRIAAALGWDGHVLFTSGASEAIAIALTRAKAARIVTSPVEHDAVLRVTRAAERLAVDGDGRVLLPELAPGSLVKRFLPYLMVSCLGILVTGLTAKGFTLLGWDIYAGQFAGIVAAACWSFNLNNRWVWLLPASSGATAKLVVTQESVPEKVVDETVL